MLNQDENFFRAAWVQIDGRENLHRFAKITRITRKNGPVRISQQRKPTDGAGKTRQFCPDFICWSDQGALEQIVAESKMWP